MSISILIIGAGGAFGRPLLKEFVRQKIAFQALAILATSPERIVKYSWAEKQGVKIVLGSFLHSKSYEGFTHVISVVGNDLLRLQPAMIEAAIETGVKHFYPSEWNSDISQKEIYSMRYFRDKQVTRSHLAAKAKEHKDFHYTLFITGIFTEWSILEFYGFDDEKLHVTTYGKPEARVGVTSIPDIARYTVSSLLLPFTPTGVSGSERTIRVTGTSTTFQGLVDSLGEAKNTTYEVDYLPVEEASRMEEQARLDGNDLSEMMWSIKPLVASGFGVADGNGSRLDNDLFDFTPETITETFSRMFKQKTKLS